MKLGKMTFGMGAAIMATAMALVSQGIGAGTNTEGVMSPAALVGKPARHRGKGQNNRRGKGKGARPPKRPNMNHVSKRVRRKHRRAA